MPQKNVNSLHENCRNDDRNELHTPQKYIKILKMEKRDEKDKHAK